MLTPPKNKFLISVDRTKDETINIAGMELWQSTLYEKYRHTKRSGTVLSVPNSVNDKDGYGERIHYDYPIQVGDVVYFHHLTLHDDNVVRDESGVIGYWQNYDMLYAVERNGVLTALEDWVFLEPIQETIEDITRNGIMIKPAMGVDSKMAKLVLASNRVCSDVGVSVGDTVMYEPNSDYPMFFGDKLYWRCKSHYIKLKVTPSTLSPLS